MSYAVCPVSYDTHRHYAEMDRAEAWAEAIANSAAKELRDPKFLDEAIGEACTAMLDAERALLLTDPCAFGERVKARAQAYAEEYAEKAIKAEAQA